MSCKFCFEFRSYSSAFLFFVLIMRCSRLFNIARLVFECTIHTHAATCVYSAQQIRTGKLHKWKESLSRRRRRLCHGCAVSISRNICKRRLALQRLIQLTAEPYECARACVCGCQTVQYEWQCVWSFCVCQQCHRIVHCGAGASSFLPISFSL